MDMVLRRIRQSLLLMAIAMLLSSCNSDDEIPVGSNGFVGYGKPMQINVSLQDGEGITRSSYLGTSKTVFITPDIGRGKWYAYNYDSTTGLWKATKEFTSTDGGATWSNTTSTQGMIWTAETMLIYAVVRNDNLPTASNAGPLTDAMSLDADQTTSEKFNKQAILGTFERVTYTTGKIKLTLQHILGRVVCNVDNCPSSQNWTCTSWGAGQHSTNPSYSNGEMGKNVNDTYGYYFRQGYLSIGDDQFNFQPVRGTLTNFQCWRFYAQGNNTKFCCWMIPITTMGVSFCFKLEYGNKTYYTKNNAYGGVSLLPGKTTTQNVTLP